MRQARNCRKLCAEHVRGTMHAYAVQGKYIASPGVAALSYGEGESPIAGGDATAPLVRELEASPLRHDAAGLVSLEVNPMVDMCALSAPSAAVARSTSLADSP